MDFVRHLLLSQEELILCAFDSCISAYSSLKALSLLHLVMSNSSALTYLFGLFGLVWFF